MVFFLIKPALAPARLLQQAAQQAGAACPPVDPCRRLRQVAVSTTHQDFLWAMGAWRPKFCRRGLDCANNYSPACVGMMKDKRRGGVGVGRRHGGITGRRGGGSGSWWEASGEWGGRGRHGSHGAAAVVEQSRDIPLGMEVAVLIG
jgi:hypothetical protein